MTNGTLFEEFMEVKRLVQMLAGIVQNDIPSIPDEELNQWVNELNIATNRLQALKIDVVEYYEKKSQI